jgi:uncharacterized sporulation protein YeaH/YhbH (DUF444 family)
VSLWDIGGQSAKDQARYREKVADSLRRRLGDVIAHESVLSAPDGTVIRIRIPEKHEPRFRYRDGQDPEPGQGQQGRDGGTRAGGVGAGPGGDIARIPGQDQGHGPGQGTPGTGHVEPGVVVEIPLSDLGELLFETLGLPRLQARAGEDPVEEDRLQGRGRSGVVLDKKRSVLAHMRREMSAGGRPAPWSREDLTWRRWQGAHPPAHRAAVVLVRDASGSIDDQMRYTIRAACFWIVRWLRRNYHAVALHFVVHDTEARELREDDFLQVGAMGGTYVSSGIALAREILDREHPASSWNRYVVFFSDGEDWEADGKALEAALARLAEDCNLIAYGELREPGAVRTVVAETVERLRLRLANLVAAPLPAPAGVAGWLRAVFGEEARTG